MTTRSQELTSLIRDVPKEKIEFYRLSFALFDHNDDGYIDPLELRAFMKHIMEEISIEEAHELVKKIDVNNNGVIDFEEFVWFMESMESEEEVNSKKHNNSMTDLAAFLQNSSIDGECKKKKKKTQKYIPALLSHSTITTTTIPSTGRCSTVNNKPKSSTLCVPRTAKNSHKEPSSTSPCVTMGRKSCTKRSSIIEKIVKPKISIPKFSSISSKFKGTNSLISSPKLRKSGLQKNSEKRKSQSDLFKVFKMLDKRDKGHIGIDDFLRGMEKFGVGKMDILSENDVRKAFEVVDKEGTGLINYDRFKMLVSME